MNEITKKDLKLWKDEIQRANIVLYEKFRDDIKIIGEGWSITDEKVGRLGKTTEKISKKLDATFEEVGNVKEKMTSIEMKITKIEKDIELMRLDIQFIKTELKKFIRIEEYGSLEKRVILLENKLKRI